MLSSPLPSSSSSLSITAQEMEGWPSSSKLKSRLAQLSTTAGLRVSWGVRINNSFDSRSARATVIMWGERRSPGPRETERWGERKAKRKEDESERGEVVRGRTVALQVLSHVVALFCTVFAYVCLFLFLKSSDSSSRSFFFLSHNPLQPGPYSMSSSALSLMSSLWAHASVLSLMWSVKERNSWRINSLSQTHKHTRFTSYVGPRLASGSDNMSPEPFNKRELSKVCTTVIEKSFCNPSHITPLTCKLIFISSYWEASECIIFIPHLFRHTYFSFIDSDLESKMCFFYILDLTDVFDQ